MNCFCTLTGKAEGSGIDYSASTQCSHSNPCMHIDRICTLSCATQWRIMQPGHAVEVQNVLFSEYSVSISQLINENTEAADMENAGHPSSETPTATNYFLQYISSRYVCQALCPISEALRSFIHLVSGSERRQNLDQEPAWSFPRGQDRGEGAESSRIPVAP